MKFQTQNSDVISKHINSYADWMHAQYQNDYYRARLLNDIRNTMSSKKDFNDFLTQNLGFGHRQVSEAGRILQAYHSCSDARVWQCIGYSGVRRLAEIRSESVRSNLINKIKEQAGDTRISFEGLSKLMKRCGYNPEQGKIQKNKSSKSNYKSDSRIYTGERSNKKPQNKKPQNNKPQNNKKDSPKDLAQALSRTLKSYGFDFDPSKLALLDGVVPSSRSGNNKKPRKQRRKSKLIALSV